MRFAPLLVVVALVVPAGCTGPVAEPAVAPSTEQTPHADSTASPSTLSSTPTPALSSDAADERAIAAEKARIRNETEAWDHLTDLSFGILRPAEYTVRSRNASTVIVAVTVGYSVTFDCDTAVDGAATKTRYAVTAEETRLVAVEQDLPDPSYCS